MTRMARTGVTEMGQTITIQGGAAFPTAHDPLELNLRSVNHRRIKANPLNPTHCTATFPQPAANKSRSRRR